MRMNYGKNGEKSLTRLIFFHRNHQRIDLNAECEEWIVFYSFHFFSLSQNVVVDDIKFPRLCI